MYGHVGLLMFIHIFCLVCSQLVFAFKVRGCHINFYGEMAAWSSSRMMLFVGVPIITCCILQESPTRHIRFDYFWILRTRAGVNPIKFWITCGCGTFSKNLSSENNQIDQFSNLSRCYYRSCLNGSPNPWATWEIWRTMLERWRQVLPLWLKFTRLKCWIARIYNHECLLVGLFRHLFWLKTIESRTADRGNMQCGETFPWKLIPLESGEAPWN